VVQEKKADDTNLILGVIIPLAFLIGIAIVIAILWKRKRDREIFNRYMDDGRNPFYNLTDTL